MKRPAATPPEQTRFRLVLADAEIGGGCRMQSMPELFLQLTWLLLENITWGAGLVIYGHRRIQGGGLPLNDARGQGAKWLRQGLVN